MMTFLEWAGWIAFGALALVCAAVFIYVFWRLLMNPLIK